MSTQAIVTAYCLCSACCGQVGQDTASGRKPLVGMTVAAPRHIPFGTVVSIRINGKSFVRRVDDRTARRFDGRWDVLVHNHKDAVIWGRRRATITIIKHPK